MWMSLVENLIALCALSSRWKSLCCGYFSCLSAFVPGICPTNRQDFLTYAPEHLLALRPFGGALFGIFPADCEEIRQPVRYLGRRKKEKKKLGSRGGVRHRLWGRRRRFPLPVITLSNVRSVSNKLDELALRAEHDCDFSQLPAYS